MKMIVLRCSILAAIILIPLTSIQHFIPPLSDCLLADICNHTWIPECAEDTELEHRRLFIDECDVYEFNCDYNVKYLIVNYSDCFGPICHTQAPKIRHLRQGNFIYQEDGRRLIYSPTAPSTRPLLTKRRTKPGKRRYTPERGRKLKKKMTKPRTTECAPCMRTTTRPNLKRTQKTKSKPHLRTIRKPMRTTKRVSKRTIDATRLTTPQVFQATTIGTVVLRRVTVYKNGMLLFKVIKGYDTVAVTNSTKEDSDFLEK